MAYKRCYNTQETFMSFYLSSFIYFLQSNILTNVKSIKKNVKVIVVYLWVPKHLFKHRRLSCQSAQNKPLMDIMSNLYVLQLGQVYGHKLMVRLVLDYQSSTDVLIPHADCIWKVITLSHVSSFQSCPEFWGWRKQTEKREGLWGLLLLLWKCKGGELKLGIYNGKNSLHNGE